MARYKLVREAILLVLTFPQKPSYPCMWPESTLAAKHPLLRPDIIEAHLLPTWRQEFWWFCMTCNGKKTNKLKGGRREANKAFQVVKVLPETFLAVEATVQLVQEKHRRKKPIFYLFALPSL